MRLVGQGGELEFGKVGLLLLSRCRHFLAGVLKSVINSRDVNLSSALVSKFALIALLPDHGSWLRIPFLTTS